MKLPVPTQGSRIWTPWLGDGGAEFALQDFFHAGTHEIHDLLRGVDDAMGVGLFDGEALEEAFIDDVDKVLFL